MVIRVAVPHQFKLKVVPDFRTLLFPDKKDVHYIGGSDILPAPLNTSEETAAINDLGSEDDESARKMLIEHNLRLVVYIAKKFDNTGVGVEDLISIGTIGLIKAINTFNPEKNIKLATYASRCIENEILMYLRRNNKTKMEVSIDEPLNVDWDGNELLLSDILGTEEDYQDAVRPGNAGWRGADPEGGCGYPGDFPVVHIKAGEEDYAEAEAGDGKVFLRYALGYRKQPWMVL